MARVTYVKKAQQRFETVAVLDDDGKPKQTPVMVKDRATGAQVQKVNKHGRPVFMKVTVADKTKPKANLRCDFGGCEHPDREIKPGQAYMHITPKSGPYGGQQRSRHADHPSWNVWEYSSSLGARIAQIQAEADIPQEFDETDEVADALSQVAEEVRSLAEEKRESASSIEDGFGHSTYVSDELNEVADSLDSWAEEIENVDLPEKPEPEERFYVRDAEGNIVEGTEEDGYEYESDADAALAEAKDDEDLEGRDGFEVVSETPEDLDDDALDEWRNEVIDAAQGIIDESPV